ncbi:hypothetical protein [Salinarimonas ramus]|uniref:Helix-turn-helix domain-containing protein n=1 Tax=Salinarimonas ramus TaxID=690164 RepID=A0A917QBK3_9HYPH|nr:hypothetical protein [Salinarimonas ramus]GGK42590.1 hypothetical protein GCM10011322_32170 [Salinarimonas ramus]
MSEEIALHHRIPDDERPAVEALRLALRDSAMRGVHLTVPGGEADSVAVPPATTAILRDVLDLLAATGQATVLDDDSEIGVEEAARLVQTPPAMLLHRLEIGDIPHRLVDGSYVLRLSDVLAFRDTEAMERRALVELGILTDEATRGDGG